ncbi:MAG: hypothetical protein M3457_15065 [Chloroflexota bacterium]|nr:hypothetical protein [Chloroflexota bacterium]
MTRTLKATTVTVAPITPGVAERFVIFAYPVCMLLSGIFVVLRTRVALIYAVLAVAFAIAFVAIHLSGDHGWETLAEKVIYSIVVVGPAMIVTSLGWSVSRLESHPTIHTRLG